MSKFLISAAILLLPIMATGQESAAPPDTSKQPASTATARSAQETMEEMPVQSDLSVESMNFCTGVEEREPVGEGTEFTTDVGTLFFWSNVLNSGAEASVEHVWYLKGEEKARVTLPLKYPRNRVWSSKIVPPEWDGEWKVEIVDQGGQVLGVKYCVVK